MLQKLNSNGAKENGVKVHSTGPGAIGPRYGHARTGLCRLIHDTPEIRYHYNSYHVYIHTHIYMRVCGSGCGCTVFRRKTCARSHAPLHALHLPLIRSRSEAYLVPVKRTPTAKHKVCSHKRYCC